MNTSGGCVWLLQVGWQPLLPPSKLRPHQVHTFTRAQGHLATPGDQAVTHVRLVAVISMMMVVIMS